VRPFSTGERVSYSIKQAAIIADQLERLATQNTHQLAAYTRSVRSTIIRLGFDAFGTDRLTG